MVLFSDHTSDETARGAWSNLKLLLNKKFTWLIIPMNRSTRYGQCPFDQL